VNNSSRVAARHPCLGKVRGTGLLLGLEVLGSDVSAAKKRNKRIVNALASEFRVLIGYEGPHASILKLRPPMPFRREHADLLVQAIDAAATAVDFDGRGLPPTRRSNSGTIWNRSPTKPTSATSKIGASLSLLIATMVRAS